MERLQVGDDVIVVAGNHRDKRGRIARILRKRDAVIVEGVNRVKKHLKPTQDRPGGILEVEAPIHASNVMPVDPETGKPTRVRVEVREGKKVRVAASGAVIRSHGRASAGEGESSAEEGSAG